MAREARLRRELSQVLKTLQAGQVVNRIPGRARGADVWAGTPSSIHLESSRGFLLRYSPSVHHSPCRRLWLSLQFNPTPFQVLPRPHLPRLPGELTARHLQELTTSEPLSEFLRRHPSSSLGSTTPSSETLAWGSYMMLCDPVSSQ